MGDTVGGTSGRGTDPWAKWLLEGRHGGDPARLEQMVPALVQYRDTVLDHADIRGGDVVVDVGCGDGLLGLSALPRVGGTGRVVFADISAELLDRCRELTDELDVGDRCWFIRTGLPDLAGLDDGSADVAMTRSVLIYVADKAAALRSLHRVLRPGGRLSVFEPINSFGWPEPVGRLWGYDVTGLEVIAAKVKDAFHRAQPGTASMVDFDERDLLAHAEAAGFSDVHMDYRVSIGAVPVDDWQGLLRYVPNPLSPSVGEVLGEALDPSEYDALAGRIQDQIAAGHKRQRSAVAYLWATR